MNDIDVQALAAIMAVYSFFEFFLRRALWKRRRGGLPQPKEWRKPAMLLAMLLTIGTSGFLNLRLFGGYIVVAVVHAMVEHRWRRVSQNRTKNKSLEMYLFKQLTMVCVLILGWRIALPLEVHGWYADGLIAALGFHREAYLWFQKNSVTILLIGAAYLFMVDGGTNIVRGILDKFPSLYAKALKSLHTNAEAGGKEKVMEGDEVEKDAEQKNEDENAGEWIGILERFITLTFVLTGSFTAIAFALTAKSIARFKELEDKDFAEYYLLGTSGSLIVAVAAGMFVRIVIGT